MSISELVEKLEHLKEKHGDVSVSIFDNVTCDLFEVEDGLVYCKENKTAMLVTGGFV